LTGGNTVKLKTTRFGEIEVLSESIINFPCGIVGLEDYKFYVIDGIPWNGCFGWMQSSEDGDLAFVITDPWIFCPDYEITLTRDDKELLSYSEESNISVYVIVLVSKDAKIVTANLFAPIIINRDTLKGKQLVLEGSNYPMKYDLLSSGGGGK